MNEQLIRDVVDEVLRKLNDSAAHASTSGSNRGKGDFGVFEKAADAVEAAHESFRQLQKEGVAARRKIVDIVKTLCEDNARSWGKQELDETKIGRLDHKIEKLQIIKLVPGVEFLQPYALSGDHGITLEEYTPFGVVGAVTPSTHSVPTIAGNIVNIIAAGNSVVFNPHPSAARVAATAIREFNKAIFHETGIPNIATIIETPTLDTFKEMCTHELTRLLCVTGGPGVVKAAMQTGKRAICAGPGNPPVLVDETADLDRAAAAIIQGGAYDNNLLCIGEKEIFVVDRIYNQFLDAFRKAGAYHLKSTEFDRLTKAAFEFKEGQGAGCPHPVVNRDFIGRDATWLAEAAGVKVPGSTELLFGECDASHAFVQEEQMMPCVPVVRVRDVAEGIELSKQAEHNYRHTSIIHSHNVDAMTEMGRALDTTLFIKNGPCGAGLGLGGEGYLSFSIATPTGEGITNPRTFTRVRRCVMVDKLRIY